MSLRDGLVCSEEDLQRSLRDGTSLHCLTRGESLGVMLIAQTGVLSLIAVLYVFAIIVRNVLRRRRCSGSWKVFEEPTDLLLASLFAIDGIQSIGAIINIAWLHRGKVETGSLCEAQGVFKQYGEVGVAFNTILIALYTFIGLWVGRPLRSMRKTIVLVSLAWIIPLILVVVGNVTSTDFHGPVPLWCWITKHHPTWRIMGEYLWMWIALALCVLMYIPIYFWNRGNFVPQEGQWWKFHVRSAKGSCIDAELRKKASIMLLYPLAYAIVVIPLSVVRWITFAREKKEFPKPMSTGATVLAGVLFASSGFLNVVLYLRTRPDTALFRRTGESGRPQATGRLPQTSTCNQCRRSYGEGSRSSNNPYGGYPGQPYVNWCNPKGPSDSGYCDAEPDDVGRLPSVVLRRSFSESEEQVVIRPSTVRVR